MGIPLRQRVVYKVAQSFQTSSFLIHSWLKKQYFLLLLLIEHFHSRESSALLHCCIVKTLQLEFGGLHGEHLNLFIVWFQLTSLRYPLLNGLINIYSIINNDKKQVQQKLNILTNLKL